MFYGKEKRVIVLRDIHSNLFEEAILVMKEDVQNGDGKLKTPQIEGSSGGSSNFILKEAETIINNYVRENKGNLATVPKERKKTKNTTAKRKFNESRFMKILIINSALIGSIAAVAFILIKIF